VDPRECGRKNGVLVHKSGAKLAMRFPDCAMSTGVDVDEKGELLVGGKGDHDKNGTVGGVASPAPAPVPPSEPTPVQTEDMRPEPTPARAKKAGYKTRGK